MFRERPNNIFKLLRIILKFKFLGIWMITRLPARSVMDMIFITIENYSAHDAPALIWAQHLNTVLNPGYQSERIFSFGKIQLV